MSLARLASGTMRTALVLRLRVTIALELLAGLLEGADVRHVNLLLLVEPATIAASMAICRPKAIDDAPIFGPKRSGGWRR